MKSKDFLCQYCMGAAKINGFRKGWWVSVFLKSFTCINLKKTRVWKNYASRELLFWCGEKQFIMRRVGSGPSGCGVIALKYLFMY